MNIRSLLLSLCALALVTVPLSGCGENPLPGPDEVAVIETDYGRIVFEFNQTAAPKHVAAFSALMRQGFYDGTKFHRVIPNRVIQGGDPNTRDDDPTDDGLGQPGQPTIPQEFSATLKHVRGTVSAARKGDNVNSATSQFFICVGPESAFDGQYTIFGQVIEGMNVVDLISRAPLRTDDPKFRERPMSPVAIKRAYVATRSELNLPAKPAAEAPK